MFVLRPKVVIPLALLGFCTPALACSTGNYIPLSGANALYYVDTSSTANLLLTTYFFDSTCTALLSDIIIIQPDGSTRPCAPLQEPGAGQFADTTCQALNTFVDGQYQIQYLGNVFQYNNFRVTTSQSTVTITPTVTIQETPLTTSTQTTTITEAEVATSTPPAVTSPATIDTCTVTPPKTTQWTTSTWTKTIVKVAYTAVPKVVPVPPVCKIEKPPRCPTLPKKPRFAPREEESWHTESEAIEAVVEERSNALAKRDGAISLQPPVTTTTLTAGLPTSTQTLAITSTITQVDTAYTTSTSTTTLPVETVYSGRSVVTVTKPTPTVTRTKYTMTAMYVTKTKTYTYTIKSTTSPSAAEITKCRKAGGHYV